MPTRAPDRLRVFQVSHNINMLDQYLARDFGFYAEEGLEVEPVIGFDFSGFRLADPVALLAEGQIDFAVAGSLVFAPAAQRGLPLRHLLVSRLDPPHWFLARPGIEQPADLKGKRIGIRPGMALFYYLVRGWLRDNGLDPDRDVEFLDPARPGPARRACIWPTRCGPGRCSRRAPTWYWPTKCARSCTSRSATGP